MLNIMVEWVAVCFIFGRSHVQISAQRLVILDKGVHGFSQSVKLNASIVPQIGPKLFPSTFFSIHSLQISVPAIAVKLKLVQLNKS